MAKPRVKICCIESIAEAEIAINTGASALGLAAEMTSGPGVTMEDEIASLVRHTPPGVATFLLTSKRTATEIITQLRHTGANTGQLTDYVLSSVYAELREALPNVKIVQVIHVSGQETVLEAQKIAPFVDALLLDSGNPNLSVKGLGGTRIRHDWSLSRQIVMNVEAPVFLAGGLVLKM